MGFLKNGATYKITSNFDKTKVFDICDAVIDTKTPVISFTWNKAINQVWIASEISPDTYMFLAKKDESFVLDDNGERLIIWGKHGKENQKFKLVPTSDGSKIFNIQSFTSDNCIIMPTSDGNLTFAEKDNDNKRQQWTFEEVDDKMNIIPGEKRKFVPVFKITGQNGEDEGFVSMDEIGQYLAEINYQKK